MPLCGTPRLAPGGSVRHHRYIMDATAHVSAADRVFEHVRQGILTRRYADNDLLAEGQIALEAGVSRTPVREALLRLEAQGMIRLLPKRGALVLPVTAQEWRDVLATRLLVESHCTRAVIESGRGPGPGPARLCGGGPDVPRDHRRGEQQHDPDPALRIPA